MQNILPILESIDDFLYYPVLIVVLTFAGIYFSFRTKFAQIRLCAESLRVVTENPNEKGAISPFQALMVSTASRVGTGNIIGVSTAICLGGPGAVFWMWILAVLGGASALVESTLAQIYKKRDDDGGSYGGPAYYIEQVLHSKFIAVLFSIFLIATYAFGFNALCSYNLQSTFAAYEFYNAETTPCIIGLILALIVAWCLFGGGKRIVYVTSRLVPLMGVIYVAVAIFLMILRANELPAVFKLIFDDAFNFQAIGSGIAGSCLMYGVKRGLYSNEAGVGSAPNAAASADTSHPVKQGLVQMLSVYIDTILICSATAFMCLVSGVEANADAAGAKYVQAAISAEFGTVGPLFITFSMILFAFTTLLGNLFYVDNALAFLNNKKMPGKTFLTCYRIICALIILAGAVLPMSAAWALADITMAFMTVINIPCIILLGGVVYKALDDYQRQRREGKDPVFKAESIGINPDTLDYWK